MARLELDAFPPPSDPGDEIEDVAWFRFPVTWNYLSGTPPAAKLVPPMRPVAVPSPSAPMALVSPIDSRPSPQSTAIDLATSLGGSKTDTPHAQWEMVIPKMVRPTAKPVADRIGVPRVPSPAPSTPVESADKNSPPEVSAPAFAIPEQSRLARSWRLLALLAIIFLAIGFTRWVHKDATAQRREQVDEPFNRGGWSRRSILPQGRMMSVYEPSREESDYRIEFGWLPDAKGVGWVFRTRDAGDYYATRISMLQPGPRVVLVVEHFSVFGGVESAHSRRVIPFGNSSGLVRVRMDAIGPVFTLSLQGSAADYWTDARLDSGPLGFYDERGQRPEVQSLRFTLINRGAGRTAAATLP